MVRTTFVIEDREPTQEDDQKELDPVRVGVTWDPPLEKDQNVGTAAQGFAALALMAITEAGAEVEVVKVG